jgi:cis-zeatin O-glucosyltransferase
LEYASKRARSAQTIPSSSGVLTNTCHALEGPFIDLFAEQLAAAGKKLFNIGPLNPLLDANASSSVLHGSKKQRHECLDWLDKQPAASVLYVSFGSTSSLRGEQVTELAAALRGSRRRFIWVLRDADRGNIFTDGGENRHAEFLS